jgi:hypothetical protein
MLMIKLRLNFILYLIFGRLYMKDMPDTKRNARYLMYSHVTCVNPYRLYSDFCSFH